MSFSPPQVQIYDQHIVWYPEANRSGRALPAKVWEIKGDNGSLLVLKVEFEYGWALMQTWCRHLDDPKRLELPPEAIRNEGAWGLLSEYQKAVADREEARLAEIRLAEERRLQAEVDALTNREEIEEFAISIAADGNTPEPHIVRQVQLKWPAAVNVAKQIVHDALHKPARPKEPRKKELAKA